jgi:hypothetical protein
LFAQVFRSKLLIPLNRRAKFCTLSVMIFPRLTMGSVIIVFDSSVDPVLIGATN